MKEIPWLDVLGLFLFMAGFIISFRVSPFLLKREKEGRADELLPASLQVKITISFIISFLGWWSGLFLLVWYLLVWR